MSVTLHVDFDKKYGLLRPLNAVNNGPVPFQRSQEMSNIASYAAAGFPYARTHDANLFYSYGGPHIVDITAVFPRFEADENDPASYDFFLTDRYLDAMVSAGTKVFYRLGQSIEHWFKKYGILPPPDFAKWARICEHIIRHYTEGWADGKHWNIDYWEIWNEPDLDPDDATDKRTWGGTERQFYDLYEIAAKHLKARFPHLKIGGPAIAGKKDWAERFLTEMKRRGVPLDFFSWHDYDTDPRHIGQLCAFYRDLLDRTGYAAAESILNEWNYVRGWHHEAWHYSLRSEWGVKGASFATGVLCVAAASPVDMLMYYDARPCAMNGFFGRIVTELLATYYPYCDFNVMRRTGPRVETDCDDPDIYALAVTGEGENHVLLTYYNDNDDSPEKEVTVRFDVRCACEIKCYLTDEGRGEEEIRCVTAAAGPVALTLPAKLFDIYHIVITAKP